MQYGAPITVHQERKCPRLQRRCWKVVCDPAEGAPFLERLFRRTDLAHGGGFTSGTIFKHVSTGTQLRIKHGRAVKVKEVT